MAVGLYDYVAQGNTEISFLKGDRMTVIVDKNPIWWKVIHVSSREMGWIPTSFVTVERSASCEKYEDKMLSFFVHFISRKKLFDCPFLKRFSWFFGRITREEAERLLMAKSNPRGTFLIRPSHSNPGKYSLSVKDLKNVAGYEIKHYKINMDNNGYYVSKTQIYPTLEALVSAHRRKWFINIFSSIFLFTREFELILFLVFFLL